MKLSDAAKKMIVVIGIASLVIIAGGAMYHRSPAVLPFALGVLITAGLNVLKLVMLERAVEHAVSNDDEKAGGAYIRVQYLLRFTLTAAVLVVAALTDFISLWGAAAGLFTLQIAVIVVKAIIKDDEPVKDVKYIKYDDDGNVVEDGINEDEPATDSGSES
jgi:hypothetical protein